MVPLGFIALASYSMDLKLESPIIVGCFRTFAQLSILGLILRPIFVLGEEHWWVVVGYAMLMILVTSFESSARSTYHFEGMFTCVLISLVLNVTFVSLFAFGLIIRPQPVLWEPQYVIPIIGMLLGNCINAVSLSLNAMLTSLVEGKPEVELLLSFGASSIESSSRLLREAVRTGAMPMLNGMAVIGIVSIPGMMTGQILGGSSPMTAAHYQMLIMYLISMCTFGTILTETFLVIRIGFDFSNDMPRTERFFKRKEQLSFLEFLAKMARSAFQLCFRKNGSDIPNLVSSETDGLFLDVELYVAPKGELQVETIVAVEKKIRCLKASCLKRSFPNLSSEDARILFQKVSFDVCAGEIVVVRGPSGVGKSQLLKLVAGLVPLEEGSDLFLEGRKPKGKMALWRQQVRYVTQSKIDISGTPRDFVQRITSFRSWQHRSEAPIPSREKMMSSCLELLQTWGLAASCLDKKWSVLSGGEAQRIIVAIALASRPKLLLLDESTSALDVDTKILVERSVKHYAAEFGIGVLWITHDTEQIRRMIRQS
jgi:putative ABC transport system permease protein